MKKLYITMLADEREMEQGNNSVMFRMKGGSVIVPIISLEINDKLEMVLADLIKSMIKKAKETS